MHYSQLGMVRARTGTGSDFYVGPAGGSMMRGPPSPLKNRSCFETLRSELLSTKGFSMPHKQNPFALRRRRAPSRSLS